MSETHPLRVVVFNETPGEAAAVSRWIAANASHYALRRREHPLNLVLHRGKRVASDRYVIYELVPAGVGVTPATRGERRRQGNPDGAGATLPTSFPASSSRQDSTQTFTHETFAANCLA